MKQRIWRVESRKKWNKCKKKSAVQSFEDCLDVCKGAIGSCAQHHENGAKAGKNNLCFAQRKVNH